MMFEGGGRSSVLVSWKYQNFKRNTKNMQIVNFAVYSNFDLFFLFSFILYLFFNCFYLIILFIYFVSL